MHIFQYTRRFSAFLKIGGDLMHDFENIRKFSTFYPGRSDIYESKLKSIQYEYMMNI